MYYIDNILILNPAKENFFCLECQHLKRAESLVYSEQTRWRCFKLLLKKNWNWPWLGSNPWSLVFCISTFPLYHHVCTCNLTPKDCPTIFPTTLVKQLLIEKHWNYKQMLSTGLRGKNSDQREVLFFIWKSIIHSVPIPTKQIQKKIHSFRSYSDKAYTRKSVHIPYIPYL